MFFKIINKNNNKEYPIRQGFTITDNYNETLDSANIIISHIKEEIDIEPFDDCMIISETPIKGFEIGEDGRYYYYLAVDGYRKNQLSIENNPYFEYQIALFSQLKHLEGIILPSLKITRGVEPRKIYGTAPKRGYLDEYLREYGQNIRTKTFGTKPATVFRSKWQYSQRVKDRFSKIDCPEMQWNNPTLRQVITDLMMIDDCIPVLKNGVIDYIDLSEKKGEMDTIGVNFIQESQSSADYVSELRMDIKNAIQNLHEPTDKIKYVQITENIGFRNSDSGLLTDQNIRVETSYPIYDLMSCKMGMWLDVVGTNSEAPTTRKYIQTYKEVDLVKENICVEKQVYDTKEVWFRTDNLPGSSIYENISYDFTSKYQNFNVYYQRGGYAIDGWNVLTDKEYFVSSKTRAFDIIIDTIAKEEEATAGFPNTSKTYKYLVDGVEQTIKIDDSSVSVDHEYIWKFFKVTYRTSADALFQASKSENATNNRVVVDNQTNSYVDANAQGILEYMKANRLGNKMKLINARYKKSDFDKIAELGQTLGDNVIFKRDVSYFDDYIMVNYYSTKGYILRDYFTGVKAKIRSWKLISGNEALVRHDLKKVYLEFGFRDTKEISEDIKLENIALDLFKNGHPSLAKHTINHSVISFHAEEENFPNPSVGDFYQSELIPRIVGNSITFHTGVKDNIYFGKRLKTSKIVGGWAQEPFAYADKNGENLGFTWILTNKVNTMRPEIGDWDELAYYSHVSDNKPSENQSQLDMTAESFRLPVVYRSQVDLDNYIETEFDIRKDNSEITNITYQIEFCSNTEDIVFGKRFIELQQLINSEAYKESINLRMYKSNTKPSFLNPNYLPDDRILIPANNMFVGVSENSVTFASDEKAQYIYITDINGRVILAFKNTNVGGNLNTKIYLNMLTLRDKNIYNRAGYIIGNIYN